MPFDAVSARRGEGGQESPIGLFDTLVGFAKTLLDASEDSQQQTIDRARIHGIEGVQYVESEIASFVIQPSNEERRQCFAVPLSEVFDPTDDQLLAAAQVLDVNLKETLNARGFQFSRTQSGPSLGEIYVSALDGKFDVCAAEPVSFVQVFTYGDTAYLGVDPDIKCYRDEQEFSLGDIVFKKDFLGPVDKRGIFFDLLGKVDKVDVKGSRQGYKFPEPSIMKSVIDLCKRLQIVNYYPKQGEVFVGHWEVAGNPYRGEPDELWDYDDEALTRPIRQALKALIRFGSGDEIEEGFNPERDVYLQSVEQDDDSSFEDGVFVSHSALVKLSGNDYLSLFAHETAFDADPRGFLSDGRDSSYEAEPDPL